MNIYFRLFSQISTSGIEKLAAPTQQQKKILAICLAAFTCLATCYLIIKRYCFKAKPLERNNPEPLVPPNIIPNDPLITLSPKQHPSLPLEILTSIFDIGLKNAFANGEKLTFFPNRVCKQWNEAFKNTFISRLRHNRFVPSMKSLRLANLVCNQEQGVCLNPYIGGRDNPQWIEEWMLDSTNSKDKNDFIIKNMWMTCFRTNFQSPHADIQTNIDLIKEITIIYAFGGYFTPQISEYLKKNQNKVFPTELYLAIIKQYGMALESVPKELITEGMCLAAVKQKGCALQFVPKEVITEEIYWAAVKQQGVALRYVPQELITEELCWAAVRQNGYALESVPKELKTEEMCLAAVKGNGLALEYIPTELKTEEMCLAAIKGNGYALQFVLTKFITREIALEAIKQDGAALLFVPNKLKTKEFCIAAVQQNYSANTFVPKKFNLQAWKWQYEALRVLE